MAILYSISSWLVSYGNNKLVIYGYTVQCTLYSTVYQVGWLATAKTSWLSMAILYSISSWLVSYGYNKLVIYGYTVQYIKLIG